MRDKQKDVGCSFSLMELIIIIAILLFLAGPKECSCSRHVAERAVEWQEYADSIRTNL